MSRSNIGKSCSSRAWALFTDAYDLFIIGVVISILKDEWHPSPWAVGLVTSTALLAAAFGAIIFGRVADMLGRKRIYGYEVLVLAAGAIASAFSPDIWWLIGFRIILGIGIGGDYPVSATLMSEFSGKKSRGMMVSLVFAMQAAGLIVGPLLAAAFLASGLSKDLVLIENFAAQAVIAIENARLLSELRKLNSQLEQRVSDQVGEIERMGRLRRFLPPQVADLIVASGTEKQLESHRRKITPLFCDLRGFTGFTESADAEDVIFIFNDPVPVENPALQAVLMALEVCDAIETLTNKWRRFGHDIGFGIGITHSYATLGTIGFEGRFDYAAIGTVSNVASRLCDEARPGQILISPRVLVAVEGAVTVEWVGSSR